MNWNQKKKLLKSWSIDTQYWIAVELIMDSFQIPEHEIKQLKRGRNAANDVYVINKMNELKLRFKV